MKYIFLAVLILLGFFLLFALYMFNWKPTVYSDPNHTTKKRRNNGKKEKFAMSATKKLKKENVSFLLEKVKTE